MQIFHNQLQLKSVFDNLKRPRHVLIVLQDTSGNYYLGSKPKFYPTGIYRFAGGGVKKHETPLQAVVREFEEELGIPPEANSFTPLAQVITTATHKDQQYQNITSLFHYQIKDPDQLKPGDDIEALEKMSPSQLASLVTAYQGLDLEDWFINQEGKRVHSWHDYGQMYAFIHQVALQLTS